MCLSNHSVNVYFSIYYYQNWTNHELIIDKMIQELICDQCSPFYPPFTLAVNLGL